MPIDHGRSGEVKVCSFEEIGGLVMAMLDDECEGEAGCEEEEEGEEGEEDGCAPAVGGEVVRVAGGGGGGGGGEQRGLFCHRKVTAVGERVTAMWITLYAVGRGDGDRRRGGITNTF